MLHTMTCLYARNNNKVTSRRHVEFEIFTKLGIFGLLGPPTGQIYGAIGPVFELSVLPIFCCLPNIKMIALIFLQFDGGTRKSLRRRRRRRRRRRWRLNDKTIVSPEIFFGGYKYKMQGDKETYMVLLYVQFKDNIFLQNSVTNA